MALGPPVAATTSTSPGEEQHRTTVVSTTVSASGVAFSHSAAESLTFTSQPDGHPVIPSPPRTEAQSQPQATAVSVGSAALVSLMPNIAAVEPSVEPSAKPTLEPPSVLSAVLPVTEPKEAVSLPKSPPQTQSQTPHALPDRPEITPVQSPATAFYESEPSSAWTNLTETENVRGGVVSDNIAAVSVPPINTTTTDEDSAPESAAGRKVFPNLAQLAASVILHRKPNTPVRYYTQVDMQSVASRRRRFGKRGFDFHLRLEGSELIVTRRPRKKAAAAAIAAASGETSEEPTLSIDATHRTVVNVRSEQVYVDAERCELVLHRKERDRPLRLALKSHEICARWENALQGARECLYNLSVRTTSKCINSFYRLGDTLGRGAYGEVVEAFDVHTEVKRAVKIVKRGTTPKSIEHLSRELDVMRSVSHDGIVQTYQIFAGKTIYIVMEYVPGGDLFDFVASQEVLTESQGAQTMRSILSAVAYLHNSNIVHRDLKPENILCRAKSWPLETKITDFGFSTVLDPTDDSVMRTPVGTAYFMAPEIITNKGHGPPVDIWACGIILYTILTGRLPFPGRNRDEYFRNVSRGRVLFPASLWKGISEDALNLVKGMLCQDPKKRLTALGVLHHKWITDPRGGDDDKGIKRNRTNLHSKRRRLYKARSAIIAVAMAQKLKATMLVDLVEKMPGGFEKMKEGTTRFAHKTADSVMNQGDKFGEGTKKLAENMGEGVKKAGEGTKKFAEKAGEGTKKFAEKAGEGVKKAGQNVEESVKKVGEGMKKTGEGIRKGAGKTTEGVKKAGQGIKKGAEKIKLDKAKLEKLKIPIDNFMQKFEGASHTGSQTQSRNSGDTKKKDVLKKKLRAFVRAEVDSSQREKGDEDLLQTDKIEQRIVELDEYGQEVATAEPNLSAMEMATASRGVPPSSVVSVTVESSKAKQQLSNVTDSDTKARAEPGPERDTGTNGGGGGSGGTDSGAIEKHSSQVSSDCPSGGGSTLIMKPKLEPLRLALGAAVDTDAYTPHDPGPRYSSEEDPSVSKLRKTAALLLMASDVSNQRDDRQTGNHSGKEAAL